MIPLPHDRAAHIKDTQVVYHDWEATHYDDKWSISFDQRCIDYVLGRFRRAVPDWSVSDGPYGRVLEIGCGTGFFLLNLAQGGVIGEAHCTDISPGMVAQCVQNGRRLGIQVHGRTADAEALPYDDATFDLVVGHAVIHHLPGLEQAFAEMARVLRPGGQLVLAGEPTRTGDRIAGLFKGAARGAVRAAAAVFGEERVLDEGVAGLPPEERHAASLETEVDLHIFTPAEVRTLARGAGFVDVRTETEELTANWFGWSTRTAEAMLRPELVPDAYRLFAYRLWRALFTFDDTVLRRVVPEGVFYNCILSARAPA